MNINLLKKIIDRVKNHHASMPLLKYLSICLLVFFGTTAFCMDYEVPPSRSTSSYVPYISDKEMERCVEIYNKAKWLSDEVDRTVVNKYDQNAVDSYNSKINHYSKMIDYFNKNCAGKQSESAYRAAQELNKKKKLELPTVSLQK